MTEDNKKKSQIDKISWGHISNYMISKIYNTSYVYKQS